MFILLEFLQTQQYYQRASGHSSFCDLDPWNATTGLWWDYPLNAMQYAGCLDVLFKSRISWEIIIFLLALVIPFYIQVRKHKTSLSRMEFRKKVKYIPFISRPGFLRKQNKGLKGREGIVSKESLGSWLLLPQGPTWFLSGIILEGPAHPSPGPMGCLLLNCCRGPALWQLWNEVISSRL